MTATFSDLYDKATEALANVGAVIVGYVPRVRSEARAKLMASYAAADKAEVIGVWKMGPSGPIEIDFAVEGSQAYEELFAVVKRWPDSRF